MAHFARLNENNVVLNVHAVDNENAQDEATGIAYLISVHGEGHIWKQTSYNGNFRKNYAGIGFTYDEQRDAFIAPQPFASWVLDEDTCRWNPPVPYPQDGKLYRWDEPTVSWVEMTP